MIEYNVIINASILIDKAQSDPSFDAGITGIESIYKNGSELQFKIDATKDCYLYIFYKTKEGLSLLTPNELEPQNKIKASESTLYPTGDVSYQLTANQAEEQNLVFVFLKSQQLLNNNINSNNISESDFFNWVYQFRKNERIIKGYNFWIIK